MTIQRIYANEYRLTEERKQREENTDRKHHRRHKSKDSKTRLGVIISKERDTKCKIKRIKLKRNETTVV